MSSLKKVLMIVGSVRPGRNGAAVAKWAQSVVQSQSPNFELEVVDLKDQPLALDDEPALPATGQYTQDTTKAWSQKVQSGNGYIFVTSEYNGGYPASLKNALDHLYAEWGNKPAFVLSYGGGGGAHSNGQLRSIMSKYFKMKVLETNPEIRLQPEQINPGGIHSTENFEEFRPSVIKAVKELEAALEADPK